MKELVEECIPIFPAEVKAGKFAEDPDIQIHKKTIKKPGYDNPVDQPCLIVKQTVQDQWIPQAHHIDRHTATRPEA